MARCKGAKRALGTVLLLVSCLVATRCSKPRHVGQEMLRVEGTAITLPKVDDWEVDTTVSKGDPSKGGLFMRLIQKSSVPGSPRIEVRMEPAGDAATLLDAYLTHNLRDMGALEAAGNIRILHVDQQPITVGHLPAWRVHHEFTTGTGATQISLYQASTLLVVDGRGITVQAAGRTELFHPLATSIAQVLDGVAVDVSRSKQRKEPGSHVVDLGTVGGQR